MDTNDNNSEQAQTAPGQHSGPPAVQEVLKWIIAFTVSNGYACLTHRLASAALTCSAVGMLKGAPQQQDSVSP